MSYKHQADCYRTIKGKRFVCWCDDIAIEENKYSVEMCKKHKIPHRIIKHPDGFKSLFVAEQDAMTLERLLVITKEA